MRHVSHLFVVMSVAGRCSGQRVGLALHTRNVVSQTVWNPSSIAGPWLLNEWSNCDSSDWVVCGIDNFGDQLDHRNMVEEERKREVKVKMNLFSMCLLRANAFDTGPNHAATTDAISNFDTNLSHLTAPLFSYPAYHCVLFSTNLSWTNSRRFYLCSLDPSHHSAQKNKHLLCLFSLANRCLILDSVLSSLPPELLAL